MTKDIHNPKSLYYYWIQIQNCDKPKTNKQIEIMKVQNMTSRNGNTIANQFIISTDKGTYFQSYDSVIAFKPINGGKIQLGSNWDYSVTTGKYRNMFLDEDKKETERKLKEGLYELNNKL